MDALKTGKIISNARKKLNMTQKDLASKLFVSDKAVSKWERGLSFPDISVLIPISEILNINLYDLLNGDETGEKKDDAILKDTINYSNKERSKLKKTLIAIIIIMSISIIILFGIIFYAKFSSNNNHIEIISPGEKIYNNYEKIATKELDDGWVCMMIINNSIDNKNFYLYHCLNIKYQDLKGFNSYKYDTELKRYYVSSTNIPSYSNNSDYNTELKIVKDYLNKKQFNNQITMNDLDGLDIKFIDKNILLELFNKAITSDSINIYGNYPNAIRHICNYEYTSYKTGETYVTSYYVDNSGYIRNVYIDLKYGNDYLSDLVKSNKVKDKSKFLMLENIKEYVIKNQMFKIPKEFSKDIDALEINNNNFYIINLMLNESRMIQDNVIRYVIDEKELER